MSAKYFCDVCERPMKQKDHGRIKRRLGSVEIEVMHCLENTWNAGHVCHTCILQAVQSGNEVDR